VIAAAAHRSCSGGGCAGRLSLSFFGGPLDEACCPAVGVACLAGGDDQHAVVCFVFQVKEPQQGDRQFRAVGCSKAEKVCGTAVGVASVPGAEPGAADAVRGGDAGEDGESGRDVEVLVPVVFVEDEGGDLEVGAGGPQPAACFGCPALCCAR
jgi:hypothetical protein